MQRVGTVSQSAFSVSTCCCRRALTPHKSVHELRRSLTLDLNFVYCGRFVTSTVMSIARFVLCLAHRLWLSTDVCECEQVVPRGSSPSVRAVVGELEWSRSLSPSPLPPPERASTSVTVAHCPESATGGVGGQCSTPGCCELVGASSSDEARVAFEACAEHMRESVAYFSSNTQCNIIRVSRNTQKYVRQFPGWKTCKRQANASGPSSTRSRPTIATKWKEEMTVLGKALTRCGNGATKVANTLLRIPRTLYPEFLNSDQCF